MCVQWSVCVHKDVSVCGRMCVCALGWVYTVGCVCVGGFCVWVGGYECVNRAVCVFVCVHAHTGM